MWSWNERGVCWTLTVYESTSIVRQYVGTHWAYIYVCSCKFAFSIDTLHTAAADVKLNSKTAQLCTSMTSADYVYIYAVNVSGNCDFRITFALHVWVSEIVFEQKEHRIHVLLWCTKPTCGYVGIFIYFFICQRRHCSSFNDYTQFINLLMVCFKSNSTPNMQCIFVNHLKCAAHLRSFYILNGRGNRLTKQFIRFSVEKKCEYFSCT